ncbi:hypothetical protein WN48_00361 [Eufriesea mexicana]|uniref:Uncharacterized protein n=1 Tax=Eufriesea mexicana TaxID=516756 RepID=A0A310SHH8_9HYME|nr:hypothetical protein WN48_00361 [Eufriesea mexicana]
MLNDEWILSDYQHEWRVFERFFGHLATQASKISLSTGSRVTVDTNDECSGGFMLDHQLHEERMSDYVREFFGHLAMDAWYGRIVYVAEERMLSDRETNTSVGIDSSCSWAATVSAGGIERSSSLGFDGSHCPEDLADRGIVSRILDSTETRTRLGRLSGLVVGGIGIWTVISKHSYVSLMTTSTYPTLAYALVIAGVLAVVGSWLGCGGVTSENRCVLLIVYTYVEGPSLLLLKSAGCRYPRCACGARWEKGKERDAFRSGPASGLVSRIRAENIPGVVLAGAFIFSYMKYAQRGDKCSLVSPPGRERSVKKQRRGISFPRIGDLITWHRYGHQTPLATVVHNGKRFESWAKLFVEDRTDLPIVMNLEEKIFKLHTRNFRGKEARELLNAVSNIQDPSVFPQTVDERGNSFSKRYLLSVPQNSTNYFAASTVSGKRLNIAMMVLVRQPACARAPVAYDLGSGPPGRGQKTHRFEGFTLEPDA